MWCIEKIICILSNILLKISSQKSFLWESENDHEKDYSPWVLCHHWLIWLWLHLLVCSLNFTKSKQNSMVIYIFLQIISISFNSITLNSWIFTYGKHYKILYQLHQETYETISILKIRFNEEINFLFNTI
jgi:hypothetical protein